MKNYKNIDDYISNFPADIQSKLQKIRQTIQKIAPDAKEKIAYGIPTFTWHGNLVHFAAYDTHIGFYPGSGPIEALKAELKDYKTSKGTVQLPLDKLLPLEIIVRLTKEALKRNQNKSKN